MTDQAQTRLKVLELARDMLHNAYVDLKAQQHNEWTARAEIALKTQGIRLPYPPFPPYFSEQEVVAKAAILLEFVLASNSQSAQTEPAPSAEPCESQLDIPPIVPLSVEPAPKVELTPPDTAPEEQLSSSPEPLPEPNTSVPVESALSRPLKVFGNWRR